MGRQKGRSRSHSTDYSGSDYLFAHSDAQLPEELYQEQREDKRRLKRLRRERVASFLATRAREGNGSEEYAPLEALGGRSSPDAVGDKDRVGGSIVHNETSPSSSGSGSQMQASGRMNVDEVLAVWAQGDIEEIRTKLKDWLAKVGERKDGPSLVKIKEMVKNLPEVAKTYGGLSKLEQTLCSREWLGEKQCETVLRQLMSLCQTLVDCSSNEMVASES